MPYYKNISAKSLAKHFINTSMEVSMTSTSKPEQILDDIIFEIQNNSIECKWFLDSMKLAELLNLSKEDFFRKLYNFKTSKPDRETRHGFSEIDGDYLIEFLQYCLNVGGIQDRFANAGIYFDERSLYELRELFKAIVRESLSRHDLDKDTLLLLSTASLDYDDAVDSYISEKFEIDFFVKRSVFEFMNFRRINTDMGAELFLKGYLEGLIPTKILNIKDITQEFRDRSFYELFGTYREEPREKSSKTRKRKKRMEPDLIDLIEFFGLKEGFTREDLKKQFKVLLKKFHPDVNKEGLEKTQEIIEKYNKIIVILNQINTRSY
ncbi:MAG: molecular chaperone DnaJ [Leptospira sp.]|nr:molecular chaperone DnaJ [Leptospira sp.]